MQPITFRHLAIGTGMLKSADVAFFLLFAGQPASGDYLPRALVLIIAWLIIWGIIWKLTGTKVFVREVSASEALLEHDEAITGGLGRRNDQ